jgi:hypothetical protein
MAFSGSRSSSSSTRQLLLHFWAEPWVLSGQLEPHGVCWAVAEPNNRRQVLAVSE